MPKHLTSITEREHRIEVEGHKLYARSWSPETPTALPPLILLHDSLGCVDLWRSFPGLLAQATGRLVIVYDRLGFGRSDPYPGKLPLDFVAAECRRFVGPLCDQMEVFDFIACGHSVGGGMAVETAAAFPDRCRAVITVAAQAFIEGKTLEGIRRARQEFQDPANVARLARYHGDKAPWVLDAWIGTWLSPDFADWSLAPALEAVRCPVLAIHGDRDEYGSNAHPERIAHGRGQVCILPDAGHVPHREQSEQLATVIGEFLVAIDAAAGAPNS